MSQSDLAEKAGMGQSAVGNMEAGDRNGSNRIGSLAKALGCDAYWLETGRGSPGFTDLLETQLLQLYRSLDPKFRDSLLRHANELYQLNHPSPSPATPFGDKRPPVVTSVPVEREASPKAAQPPRPRRNRRAEF